MPCDRQTDRRTDDGLSALNRLSTKMDAHLTREKGMWKDTKDVKVTNTDVDKCLYWLWWLQRVVQHHILSGELQQHRIIEELVDRYIFTQTFATASLDHKLTSKMSRRLWLKGADNDALIQRITGNNLQRRAWSEISQKVRSEITLLHYSILVFTDVTACTAGPTPHFGRHLLYFL